MELFRVTLNQGGLFEETIMCPGCLEQLEQFLEIAQPSLLTNGDLITTPLPFPMVSQEILPN